VTRSERVAIALAEIDRAQDLLARAAAIADSDEAEAKKLMSQGDRVAAGACGILDSLSSRLH